MKMFRLITFITICLIQVTLRAQTSLPESSRNSANFYIYTVDRDNLRKVYLKDKEISEEMLGKYMADYPTGTDWPDLPRGNYMVVKAIDGKLNFSDYTVDDLYYKTVPAEEMRLCLYDSLGNIVTDATVKYGARTLRFDKNTQTYNTKKVKDGDILEVNNKGVYHYIEIEKSENYYYAQKKDVFSSFWRGAKRFWYSLKQGVKGIFHPDEREMKDKYTGFIVFSKPRYKPGETVKMKAYLADHHGKPYNKPVDIRLNNYYRMRIDTLLASVDPYRPGMYEYEFELSEKLNLSLDLDYNIQLSTGEERYNKISNRFRYEDYELKGIHFSVETDKEKYIRGDSVKLKFNIKDENELDVYDGKVDLLVRSRPLSYDGVKHLPSGFVRDTLWTHTVSLDLMPEREISLPDSIFPEGVSLTCQLSATYLSADNEKHTSQKYFSRKYDEYSIDFALKKGMLAITQLHEGKSQPVMADISVEGENGEVIQKMSVMLPFTLPLPWYATDVTVKTIHSKDCYFTDDIKDEQIGCEFYRLNDSIYLKVDNPAAIPFWYAIYRNNSRLSAGYTTELAYTVKDKNDAYSVQLGYLLGETNKVIERSVPFVQKNISMDVSTPTTVYPGQKADVQITVTDKKGKPVSDVDITAWSFTSKFGDYRMPDIAIRGKAKYGRSFKQEYYEADDGAFYNRKADMTWDHWKGVMALDTIAYYNFLYPETYFVYTEPTADKTTLVSPYVVIDGALQMVHTLFINERLYYTSVAEQMNVYAFPVDPGNHTFRFRTHDREISVHNVYVKEGERNIFSFNAKPPYMKLAGMDKETDLPFVISSRLLKEKEQAFPNADEGKYLSSQLITIDNNFGSIQLPNLHQTVEIPGYIKSGDWYYYINHTLRQRYEYALRGNVSIPVVVGPFPRRSMVNGLTNVASVYRGDNELLTPIELEGGNKYTVYPGFQKIKSWDKAPFTEHTGKFTSVTNFRQNPLTADDILKHHGDRILSVMRSSRGPAEVKVRRDIPGESKARLDLYLGKDKDNNQLKPALIFIVPEAKEDIGKYQLYYGETRNFNALPTGKMNVSLIFNDSTSCTRSVMLRSGGQNFLCMDSVSYDQHKETAAAAFSVFNRGVSKVYPGNPYQYRNVRDSVVTVDKQYPEKYRKDNVQKGDVSGIVYDSTGDPLIGASVRIAGTTNGTVCNIDGYYELSGVASGDKIEVLYIGYIPKTVKYSGGHVYNIKMEEDSQALDEVVVVGYGTQKKYALTGSVTSINPELTSSLQGSMAGIMIRGTASNVGGQPLILVNGVPYNGNLSDLDTNSIVSINILKDASATAIYGTRAADGVIMIQTNAPVATVPEKQDDTDFPAMEAGNTMRRNFHDDAFWQPRLKTDDKGVASFQVTYPDDITSWDAYFIAVGNRKQADKRQMTIKSFKALVAALSAPRFAVRGDSLNAVGKITNHVGDSLSVKRKIEIAGKTTEEDLRVVKSHIDYIPVTAKQGDSLTIAYSMKLANGYFDGEERSVPILEQGLLQTRGEFRVLSDTAIYTFTPDPGLGTVTIHAEASSLEAFLEEIEKVDSYPYMCNEQMASKIKVLLARKRIAGMFNKDFKDDKKINNLIKRLNNNKNKEGLWGWWDKSSTESWISNQVISALLDAEETGYTSGLDMHALEAFFMGEFKSGLSKLQFTTPKQVPYAKRELLQRLITLKRINAPIEYTQYFEQIDTLLPGITVADKLKTMETMAVIGLKDKIDMDSLMHYSRKTMLGSMFWGDAREDNPFFRHFILPYDNNTDNTLIAYKILKAVGGYEKEMEKVQNYFFERRQGGSWANTYESSRIIETIMPDVLKPGQEFAEVTMNLNDRKITKFPFTEETESYAPVRISKDGVVPVFLTVYQQTWNPEPEPESAKGFTVKSVFTANGDTISYLTAGKTAQLDVTVTVDADAEYIQIEVPIPAGCTYDSKRAGNYWKEAHREHFKDKVVIFSNKLTKGEHTFTVHLLPRFTGKYSLNPAKAELMYFPVFYGNEEMKRVVIE